MPFQPPARGLPARRAYSSERPTPPPRRRLVPLQAGSQRKKSSADAYQPVIPLFRQKVDWQPVDITLVPSCGSIMCSLRMTKNSATKNFFLI